MPDYPHILDQASSGGSDPQANRTKTAVQASEDAEADYSDGLNDDEIAEEWTATGVTPEYPYVAPGVRLPLAARSARIMRVAPAASEYEIVVEYDYLGGVSSAHSAAVLGQIGPVILDVNGSGVSGGIHTADPARIWLHQITAYQYVGVYGAGQDPGVMKTNRITIALHKNGNDYRMRYSNDGGTTWGDYTAASTVAFTPTQIGFGRWHTGGTANDNSLHLRSFRVFTPSFS